MTDHPITPPPELVQQWASTFYETTTAPGDWAIATATQAARWGADQELEACCEWLRENGLFETRIGHLRAARRPKPPSLKEQALETFDKLAHLFNGYGDDGEIVRRALEALPE